MNTVANAAVPLSSPRGSVPSKPLGAPKSPLLNSRSFVTDSKNPPPPSSRSYERNDPTTSRSSNIPTPSDVLCQRPTPSRPSTNNSRFCVVTAADTSIPKRPRNSNWALSSHPSSPESGTASPLPSRPRSTSSTPCLRQDSRRNDARGHNIIDKCPGQRQTSAVHGIRHPRRHRNGCPLPRG